MRDGGRQLARNGELLGALQRPFPAELLQVAPDGLARQRGMPAERRQERQVLSG